MKKLLTILFVFSIANATSQFKKVEKYTTTTGITINKGDAFIVGSASGQNDSYLYLNTKPSVLIPVTYPLGSGLDGAKFKIEYIQILKEPIGGLSGGSFVFKIKKQKILVDIENAIKTREIIIE